MEGTPEAIKDRMRRYGLSKKEALAGYHIRRAEELFKEIFAAPEDGIEDFISELYNDMYHGVHFRALDNALSRRALRRDYPEGWGRAPEGEAEEGSE